MIIHLQFWPDIAYIFLPAFPSISIQRDHACTKWQADGTRKKKKTLIYVFIYVKTSWPEDDEVTDTQPVSAPTKKRKQKKKTD
jgi:hypothetical protein